MWPRRLRYPLALMGPGLIVMVGDDAGGVATYAQAGQGYGAPLLRVVALLIPVPIVCQEMAVRLGAATGVGHARLIHERFGRCSHPAVVPARGSGMRDWAGEGCHPAVPPHS